MQSKNKIHRFLGKFAEIRPGETSIVLLLFFYFFLLTTTAYIIKPGKISLFLQALNYENLPWAYLLTAIIIGIALPINTKLLYSMNRTLYISLSLVFFIISLLVFRLLFPILGSWFLYFYWVWVELFAITSITQFWILVNDIYNPHQAKRLLGFLVSGGLLGGVAGSVITSFLAKNLGTENLIFICPFLLLLCLILVNRIHKFTNKNEVESEFNVSGQHKSKFKLRDSFSLFKQNRYLLLMSSMVVCAILVTTFIDFQFNSIVKETYTETDLRTSFLGTFFTLLLIFSYLLHIILTKRILKNFGLRTALLIAPVFILAGSIVILFLPALFLIYWAVAIKGLDKSLSHSLSQTVRELLYIPVPSKIKYRSKMLIDMLVNKFAKGLGAIILLLFVSLLNFKTIFISIITLILTSIWIIINILITKEYVNLVKQNLKIKWQDADKLIADNVDIDLTKLVFETMQSKERSSVLYAMNLFDLIKNEKLSPELKKIISHKSDEIMASSMDSLLELDGEALLPETEEDIDTKELGIQIDEIMSQDAYQNLMTQHINHVIHDDTQEAEVSKMEVAKILGMMKPSALLAQNLRKLLKDPSTEVITYALESAAKIKKRGLLPYIIQHLANSPTQRTASQTLVSYGDKIIGTLQDYLFNSDENIIIRKTIPDILAQIGTQSAADGLVKQLSKSDDKLESNIIESLYKMAITHPSLIYQKRTINKKIIDIIKHSCQLYLKIHELDRKENKLPLSDNMNQALSRNLKHIFELLSLIYPRTDIISAYQNICVGTKKSIDYSFELLDNILDREIKELIFPLIDDMAFEDKASKLKQMLKKM